MLYFWTPKIECIPPLVTELEYKNKSNNSFLHTIPKKKCLTQILNELDFYLIWVFICRDKK